MTLSLPASAHKVLQPADWPRPKGYANGIAAKGTAIYVGGQVGWNADEKFESDDFVDQARQAIKNILTVLAEAGAGPEHIVSMTWYVVDMDEYLGCRRELGHAYREVMGEHYPATALVQVVRLAARRARLEIEATAVVP